MKFSVYFAREKNKGVTRDAKVVSMNKRRILVVEDEEDIAELVALHLSDLCDEVVVAADGHEGCEHTVNSHINRLRAKIERDPSHPEKTVTVWGVGYKFSGEARV